MTLSVQKTSLPDVLLLRSQAYSDSRGSFMELWNEQQFLDITGFSPRFVQDNQSVSHRGVLRGLHFQNTPHEQGKLVRCASGAIFDVAVDLRPDSPAFLRWEAFTLRAEENTSLWIPPGFAHGFLALKDLTVVQYKVTKLWVKESEGSIRWNDPDLRINWPDLGSAVTLSQKDLDAPLLSHILPSLKPAHKESEGGTSI